MAELASIETIRAKLQSPNERTRSIALIHAAAHGPNGRELAPAVARMFEDASAAVQYQAVHTFREIARDAAAAVPVLLALRAKGAPAMLVSRATFCLGWIGPAANDAVPVLEAALRAKPDDTQVLEALIAIAPESAVALDSIAAGVFSDNGSVSFAATKALERLGPAAIDRVIDAVETRVRSGDPKSRALSGHVLSSVAAARPERAADLLRDLLRDPASWEARASVGAVAELPAPVPVDLIDAAARIVEHAAITALPTLAALGPAAAHTHPVLIRAIEERASGPARPDEEHMRVLAAAAKAIAAVAPDERVVAPLVAWLDRTCAAPESERSWYELGDVVEALAVIAPASPAVHDAILRAVEVAEGEIEEHESSVLDFERAVRRAFDRMPDPDELYERADAFGMSREDPYADEEEEEGSDEGPFELPAMPDDDTPDPVATLVVLEQALLDELWRMIADGVERIGAASAGVPKEIAGAVDRWITHAQRAGDVPGDDLEVVGAAYGHAIAKAAGWEWRFYVREGKRYLAVASPDGAHVCLPFAYLHRQVTPRTETTALLLFNMICAGNMPDSRPGACCLVG